MSDTRAITLIRLEPPDEREDEWNEWYTNEHSPGRFENDFLAFRRFEIMEGHPQVDTRQSGQPKYLAIMELPNTDVLNSASYAATTERWAATPPDSFEHLSMTLGNFSRGVFELTESLPSDAPFELPESKYVFLSAHQVPAEVADEFNEWYVEEHIPPVLEAEGFNSVRRFVHKSEEFPPMLFKGGELFTHLALWEIDNETVFMNPRFATYTPTPWQKRMRRLFTLKVSNVYKEIGRGINPDI